MRNTLLLTTSENHFISENGIVAVLGDEDQHMTGDITRTNKLPDQFLGGRSEIEPRRGADVERGGWVPRLLWLVTAPK